MHRHRANGCAHPVLNGRSGTCADCGASVWYYEPRAFTPAELAVQRAVSIMSRRSSIGLLPS